MRFVCSAVILAISTLLPANPVLVRKTGPLSPEEELKGFTVPDGFAIQLFASEPMINKPINLAWDTKGRLWVSSTAYTPMPREKTDGSTNKGRESGTASTPSRFSRTSMETERQTLSRNSQTG